MISAAEENEHPAGFRVGVDDDGITQGEIGNDGGTKFSAIGIEAGVDGVKNFDMKNRTRRQGVERIRGGGAKTGLQVKGENGSGGGANGFDDGTGILGVSGVCEHSDRTQDYNKKWRHGPGLSAAENKRRN